MQGWQHNYDWLSFSRPADGVLKITMPEGGNLGSVDEDRHTELTHVWLDVDRDPDIRVALLTGEGKAFSAGGDFDMIERIMDDYDTRLRMWREGKGLVQNIIECSKPIIAAIRGPAVGAGLVAALLADISIASKTARLVDGHTRLGVAAGDHAPIIWPLLCGMAKAKYYLLLCDPIDGEEAERIGLVSKCVEDAELDEAALDAATRLAQGPSTAIMWTKHTLNHWLRLAQPSLDAALALEFLGFTGPEPREGLAAHREKRAPNFQSSGKHGEPND